ncbi:MAG: NAD(P)/FAD-dependent oxidoreductase, partial [Acidimicrobiales bacterium]
RRLRVPGAELEGIYQLRTVDEADRIREEIAPGRKAVVVGMGFIGCEVAASLRRRGVEVTAVEPMKGPLAPVLGQEVSRVIEAIHRDQGVEMIFGEAVAAFEGDDRVERVVTNGGRAIDCGFAVVGVGIEPEAGLVDGTGIEVSNGIVVDEHCRTSVEGVFAAGDVANHYHPVFRRRLRVEHYQNAINQGRAAAKAMLGSPEPYDDVHWFWSDQYDDNLQYAGYHREWDDLVVRGSLEQRRFVAFYLKDGLVLAAVGLNNGRDLRRSIPLIKAGSPVERARLADGEVDLRTLAR